MGVATSALMQSMRGRMEIGKKYKIFGGGGGGGGGGGVFSVYADTHASIEAFDYGRLVFTGAETAKRAVRMGHIATASALCVTEIETHTQREGGCAARIS